MGVKVREKVKGSGVWWLYVDHKGRRTAKRIGSKEVAETKAAELVSALTDQAYRLPSKKQQTTLRGFGEDWMKGHVAQLKPATVRDYRDTLNKFLYPVFGSTPLDCIKRTELKAHCFQLHHVVRVLSAVLNMAIEDELLPRDGNVASSPGRFVKLPRPGEKADALSSPESDLLLDVTLRHDPEFYPIPLLLLRGGLRKGELRALQWSDLDRAARVIEVKRAFSRNELSTPKSGKPRPIGLGDKVLAALEDHRRRMEIAADNRRRYLAASSKERKGMNRGQPMTEWVFSNPKGKPWGDSYINGKLERMLKLAGLRHIRVHDLRHTMGSQNIQKGVDLSWVSRQLGHSDIRLTQNTYGNHLPVDLGPVNRLDEPDSSATGTQPAVSLPEEKSHNVLN
jgi:integrase